MRRGQNITSGNSSPDRTHECRVSAALRARRAGLLHRLLSSCGLSPHAFRKLPAAGFAVPFLERFVRDLPLDEKLGELASLRLTLERHAPPPLGGFLAKPVPPARRRRMSCRR